MILQALRAELFKLRKNRWTAFWAFGFMPLFTLAGGLVEETLSRFSVFAQMLAYAAPISSVFNGLSSLSNPVTQIFPVVGAATLFAGEYRWETWRAILPRTERTPMMLAKILAFAIATALSIIACGVCGLLVGFYDAFLVGSADWPASGAGAVTLALVVAFLATFLQVMTAGGIALLISVLSRSGMAAIVGTLVLLVALELASIRFRLPDAEPFASLFPNLAGRGVREFAYSISGDPDAVGMQLALPGAISLIAWFLALSTAALAVFRRQDLSRE